MFLIYLSRKERKILSLKKIVNRRRLLKLFHLVPGNQHGIRRIESTRGLYQYPDKMLGRNFPLQNSNQKTDVLVFAAHYDDDVLGVGTTLYRHSQNGDNIKVVFVTNGSADWLGIEQSWNVNKAKSKVRTQERFKEAVDALSLLHIPTENIYCLGFPDGGTHRYLKHISTDVQFLLEKLNPGKVYVHCIEGGHPDHDMVSFAVKSTCQKVGYHNVFEWAEYNPEQPIGTKDVKFRPNIAGTSEEVIIDISEEERMLKRNMLSYHKSQDVEQYYLQGEAIRKANLSDLDMELDSYCQLPKSFLPSIIKK